MKQVRKIRKGLVLGILIVMALMLGVSASAAGIKLNKSKATIDISKTLQLKLTGNSSGLKVKWKSSNSKIASVNSRGKVTGKKSGSCTISAIAGKKSYKCRVTVKSGKITDVSKVSDLSAVKAAKSLGLKAAGTNGTSMYTKNGRSMEKTDTLRAYSNLRNNSYGMWWFDIYSKNYSVYGTKVRMTMNEAKNKLKAKGWKVIGNDYSFNKIRVSRLEKGRRIVFFYIDDITQGNRITSISYYNYRPSPHF